MCGCLLLSVARAKSKASLRGSHSHHKALLGQAAQRLLEVLDHAATQSLFHRCGRLAVDLARALALPLLLAVVVDLFCNGCTSTEAA